MSQSPEAAASRPPVLIWNPNPTLDVVNSLLRLDPGTVHRASEQTVSPGGKGTLVLRGLLALGVSSVGFAPLAGQVGEVVAAQLLAEELPFVTTEVAGETRLAITLTDERGTDTVINGPGPRANGSLWRKHIHAVADGLHTHRPAYFVIAGRPPLDIDLADVRFLMREARDLGARTVLDLASPILEACLALRPWLVKINTQEAREAAGASSSRHLDLAAALVALGAENAVVTDGSRSVKALLGGSAIVAEPPSVDLVSAVGCGDSFLAGLIEGMRDDPNLADPHRLIRRAVGTGSASAEDLRPGFFSPERAAVLEMHVHIS